MDELQKYQIDTPTNNDLVENDKISGWYHVNWSNNE